MNLMEAFSLLEWDETDKASSGKELTALQGEIEQLEQELKILDRQYQDTKSSVRAKYSTELEALKKETEGIEKELKELDAYYTTYETERDDDGDRYYYYQVPVAVDEKRKAEVADKEADARLRLEAAHKKAEELEAKITAEVDASPHKDKISTGKQSITDKKNRIQAITDQAVEEAKEELDSICAAITEKTSLKPLRDRISLYKNSMLILPIEGVEHEKEYDDEDFEFDLDDSSGRFKFEDADQQDLIWHFGDEPYDTGEIYELATALGIDENAVSEVDSLYGDEIINIPNSSWKLLLSLDIDTTEIPELTNIDYTPANIGGRVEDSYPAELDYDMSGDFKIQFTYYLVKNI